MSTLRVTNVQDTAGANSLTTAQIYNGAAKAWVNFNGSFGTSPFTIDNGGIRASFNVSSITDNGTGDYTITFTNAMVDANYAVIGSTTGTSTLVSTSRVLTFQKDSQSTSSIRIYIIFQVDTGAENSGDTNFVSVAVFR